MLKKNITCFFILSLLLAAPAIAQTTTKSFTVSATVPAAASIGINAFSVNSSTNIFTPITGTFLNFNPLNLDPVSNIYLPNHFWVIDISGQGGAVGNMSTTFEFRPGLTPNVNGHGIGHKTTLTFVKVTSVGEGGLIAHGTKQRVVDITGETILGSETSGGFLRCYLGIVTMDPNAVYTDPNNAEVFSNADAPGNYDGILLISSTLL